MTHWKSILALVLFTGVLWAAEAPSGTNSLEFEKEASPETVFRERAQIALKERMYDIAIANLEEYLKRIGTRQPDFVEATIMMATACIQKNNPEEAIRFIEYYQTHSKETPSAELTKQVRLLTAEAHSKLGHWNEALRLIEEAAAGTPFTAEELRLLADCYLMLGQYDNVIKLLTTQHDQRASNPSLTYRLAEAYLAQGKYPEAQRLLPALADNPAFKTHHALLNIRCLAGTRATKQAQQEYDKIKNTMPDSPDDLWHATLMTLGKAFYEAKEYPQAVRYISDAEKLAVTQDARNNALSTLVMLHIVSGDANRAKDALALIQGQTAPSQLLQKLKNELAHLLEKQGNHNDAADLFLQLAGESSGPAAYEAYLNAAICQEKAGLYANAIKHYLEAEKLGSTDAEKAIASKKAAETAMAQYTNSTEKSNLLYDQAIQALTRSADLYAKSQNSQAAQAGAEARFQLAKLALSVKAYTAAINAFDTFFKEAAREHPNREEAGYLQTIAQRHVAQTLPEKESILARLLEMGSSKSRIADNALLEAYSLAEECGLHVQAEKALSGIIGKKNTLSGEHRMALYLRALFYLTRGEIKKGRDDFSTYTSLYQNEIASDKLSLLFGDAFASRGELEEALKYYTYPLALKRSNAVILRCIYESADCCRRLNRHEDALKFLSTFPGVPALKAASLDTPATMDLYCRACYLKGDILSILKNFPEAEKAYRECRIQAGNTLLGYSAQGRMGEMLMEIAALQVNPKAAQNIYVNADKFFREIISADTAAIPVRHTLRIIAKSRLAISLCRQGKTEEALQRYEDLYTDLKQGDNLYTALNGVYFQNTVLDMASILEQRGDMASLEKLMKYYQALANANLGVSDTARERLRKLQERISGKEGK